MEEGAAEYRPADAAGMVFIRLANYEWEVPNAPNTRFHLASIAKTFTATLLLQQIDPAGVGAAAGEEALPTPGHMNAAPHRLLPSGTYFVRLDAAGEVLSPRTARPRQGRSEDFGA